MTETGTAEPDLTIAEAAAWLDPPISQKKLAALIGALEITPTGVRRKPGKGRPAATYDAAEIQDLHAAVARWLPVLHPTIGA